MGAPPPPVLTCAATAQNMDSIQAPVQNLLKNLCVWGGGGGRGGGQEKCEPRSGSRSGPTLAPHLNINFYIHND